MSARDDLPEERAARDLFWAERLTVGQAVLERGQARDELRPRLDCRLTIETLIGVICVQLLLTREPVDATPAERITDLVMAGIAGPPPAQVSAPRP